MKYLQVELTNRCNLQCVECPHRFMKRPFYNMEKDVFDRVLNIIEETQPLTVIPHKDGEPLLHPDFFEYMKMISEISQAKFDIYTNGIPLTRELVEKLDSLGNKIFFLISFHFHKYDGTKYSYLEVNERIEEILSLDLKHTEFVFATHVTDLENEEKLNIWKKNWELLSDKYYLLKAVHVNKAINPWTGLISQKNCISFDACPYQNGEHLFVGNTGNILPCCMDLEEELTLANIMEDDLNDIIQRRNEFYENLEQGELDLLCRKCLGSWDTWFWRRENNGSISVR